MLLGSLYRARFLPKWPPRSPRCTCAGARATPPRLFKTGLLAGICALALFVGSSGCAAVSSQSQTPPSQGPSPPPAQQHNVGQLTVGSTALSLGNAVVGTQTTAVVVAQNVGSGDVTLSQVIVTGSGFSAATPPLPATVPAGGTISITFQFTPQSSGPASGTATLLATGANPAISIALSGVGLAASSQLTALPSSLGFNSVPLGSSASQVATLVNAGNLPIVLSGAIPTQAEFSGAGLTPGMSLAPADSTTVTVTFAPSGTGLVNGSLLVTSNAANSPTAIQLSGLGIAPPAHFVSLSWQAVPGFANTYNVYRGTISGGPYTQQNAIPISATSFTDFGVSGSTTYYYVVTTVAYNGEQSLYSAEVSASVPPNVPVQ